jgi:signal transduction histidine kinase/ActR/RegA family two-component response regulator
VPLSTPRLSPAGASILAAAIALAAGLNGLDLEVIDGARIFLGAFVIMPFVLSRPPLWAVLTAMLSMLPSVFALHHPFALFLAGTEAAWLVVGVRYFRRNAILVDGVFWLVAGVPLGRWWHVGVGDLPHDLAWVVLATHAATGMAAVAVGYFVLRYTTLGARLTGARAEKSTVREVIFNYVFVLSLVPLTFVALGFSLLSRQAAESEARERAFYATRDAVRQIDLFFELHQSALVGLARVLEQSGAGAPVLLEETKRAHPRFLTMLVTDALGQIVQVAPADQLARLQGSSVADREYFRTARDSRRPFVSGVFRGRGFGRDILVAMSVPMFDRAGGFMGIVEASVRVDSLARLASATSAQEQIQLVLADSAGRVIYADEQTGLSSLQRVQDTPLAPALKSGGGLTPFAFDRIDPDGTRSRVSNRAERCRTVGIMVIAQWPVLNALEGMKTAYALMFAMLIGIIGSAAFVARAAHRRLSAPLEKFSRHTTYQLQSETVAPVPILPAESPHEVNEVYATFNRLAIRLNETHAELRRHNAELDHRVAERTRDAEAARRQAEAANRSKTDFLAMTSHEIRTPLNAISGLAEVVAANPSDPRAAARARTIRDASTRLLGVVNDLLDLSRAEAGKLELRPAPVELGALCADLRALFSLRAEQQGLRLEFAVAPALPLWLETDGPRLQQVLINLIGNALKFTARGGVTLRIDRIPRPGPEIELRFAVIDSGPGIPAEAQARLFQPYVQLAPAPAQAQPGSGLGLAISRRLVALFGGELALRSAPGEGAEFFFSLVTRGAVPPAPAPAVAAAPAPAARLRVLAVDDNAANREVLRGLLESRFGRVEILGSGRDAIQALQQENFDVALIDLEMPDLDGLEVARTVRSWRGTEASRGCRLVAFSAHGRAEIWTRCEAAGFDDFVEKPIDRRELHRALTAGAAASQNPSPLPP